MKLIKLLLKHIKYSIKCYSNLMLNVYNVTSWEDKIILYY